MKTKNLGFTIMILIVMMLSACTNSPTPTESTVINATSTNEVVGVQTQVPEVVTNTPVEPKQGGILKVAIMIPIQNLNWIGPMALQDNMIESFIFEPLFYYDYQTGTILPYLAESYDLNKADLTLTIKIKKGIFFSDGSELNAANVKWCLEYFRDKSQYGTQYLGNVKDIEILDNYTVKLILSSQNIALLFNLTNRAGDMYSKKAFDTYGDAYISTNPIGTGPFVMTEWKQDEVLKLAKNPNYWNGPVYLDGVEIYPYSESLVAQGAIETGTIDAIYGQGIDRSVASTLVNKGFKVQPFQKSSALYVVGFNCNDKDDPFYDIRVRQAVSYAIDADAINNAINYGFAQRTNQWSLPGTPYYNNDVVGYPYNVDKALELMKEAGFANGFKTRLTFRNNVDILNAATIIQAQLAKIGIEVELNSLDTATFITLINDWQYGMILHTATYEPAVTTKFKGIFDQSVLTSTALALGKANFLHPDDLNAAIENAIQSFTSQDEAGYIREAQKLVIDKYALWDPLYALSDTSVYANYVMGWDYLATGKAGDGSAHIWLNK
jgi:peptide/nickel transport system substrate-binding protein